MQYSPSWESNRLTVSQEISCVLCSMKFHYRIHKSPPPVAILSQLNPFHSPSHFLKIQLNVILPSTPGSPKWSYSFMFPHRNPVYTSLLPPDALIPNPSHSSRFYHLNNIGWGVSFIKLRVHEFRANTFGIAPSHICGYFVWDFMSPIWWMLLWVGW
jgi:hypothetical protein